MNKGNNFQKLGDLLNSRTTKKAPAYSWQDLALRIITELKIPPFKKSSVFKICRDNSQIFIERCLTDTKELCQTGAQWKYFFKLIGEKKKS